MKLISALQEEEGEGGAREEEEGEGGQGRRRGGRGGGGGKGGGGRGGGAREEEGGGGGGQRRGGGGKGGMKLISALHALRKNHHSNSLNGKLHNYLIVCLLNKATVARLRGCCSNYYNHTWSEVFSSCLCVCSSDELPFLIWTNQTFLLLDYDITYTFFSHVNTHRLFSKEVLCWEEASWFNYENVLIGL